MRLTFSFLFIFSSTSSAVLSGKWYLLIAGLKVRVFCSSSSNLFANFEDVFVNVSYVSSCNSLQRERSGSEILTFSFRCFFLSSHSLPTKLLLILRGVVFLGGGRGGSRGCVMREENYWCVGRDANFTLEIL